MREGEMLKRFVENQKASKIEIAKGLNMSRQNLYQLFESEHLEMKTKKRIEQYFKTPIFEWSESDKKSRETSSFPNFIRGIGNVFSDMVYPDPFRERIKNAVYELHEVYQSKEIYRRMGIPPYLGNEVLFGVTSPKSFIDALVSEFNINYAYIMDGTLPIRLPKNPDEKENLIKAIAEKDKLISAQKATIDSQKVTIDSQQKLIATLQKT